MLPYFLHNTLTHSLNLFAAPTQQLDLSKAANIKKKNPYLVAAENIENTAIHKKNLKNVFEIHDVTKQVGDGRVLLENVNTSVFYGAKIGIIGPNGSGKSSFLKILAGIDDMYSGDVIAPKSVKVGYLHQEPSFKSKSTVEEIIRDGLKDELLIFDGWKDATQQLESTQDPKMKKKLSKKQKVLGDLVDQYKLDQVSRYLDIAAAALRLPPRDSLIENLSGGEQRRVALCKLLLEQPDVLLLDEPTNHLDAESVTWLEHYLQDFPGTVMTITHDRYFLENISEYICEVDPLAKDLRPIPGNYSEWLETQESKLDDFNKEHSRKKKQLKEELLFLKAGSKGRDRTKSRIKQYKNKHAQMEEKSGWTNLERNQIVIPHGPRLGDICLYVENLTMKQPDSDRTLFKNLSFNLPSGAILGVVGPNGCGKSTLVNCITGKAEPESGNIDLGATVKLGVLGQMRDDLNDGNTVFEEISEGHETIDIGNTQLHMRNYVASFNFRSQDQKKLIGQLSGGERNRVHLAKNLKNQYNVLILDEPSNDLDVDTLRSLEDGIQDFPGSAIVVSHDRYFLNSICTHILAFEGDKVVFLQGNYHDYELDRIKRLGEPPRFKFIKIAVREKRVKQ